jgi:hypothetical protein
MEWWQRFRPSTNVEHGSSPSHALMQPQYGSPMAQAAGESDLMRMSALDQLGNRLRSPYENVYPPPEMFDRSQVMNAYANALMRNAQQ